MEFNSNHAFFLNTCAMKVRKKLILFSTCEGGFTDHHLSIPSIVENLVYPYKKLDVCFVSGHEMVRPHGVSNLLTPVVSQANKRAHHPGGSTVMDGSACRGPCPFPRPRTANGTGRVVDWTMPCRRPLSGGAGPGKNGPARPI